MTEAVLSTKKLLSTIAEFPHRDIFKRASAAPLLTPAEVQPSDDRLKVIGVLNPTFFSFDGFRYLIIRVDERPVGLEPPRRRTVVGKEPLLVAYADLDYPGKVEVAETQISEPFLQDNEPILPRSAREYRLGLRQQELLLSYISHLRIVELTTSGVHVTPAPLVCPSDVFTQFGCEDPRVTMIEGRPQLLFSAIGPYGATSWLATIGCDNTLYDKKMVLGPDHKHSTLFPSRVGDHYYLMTRPLSRTYLRSSGIWLLRSLDMIHWGSPSPILLPRPGMWDGIRVGPSTPPLLTEEGWLVFYYGVDHEDSYRVGVALFERENPNKLIARSVNPVLGPALEWERNGRRADIVFPCGIEVMKANETIRLYYGAADTCIGSADVHLPSLLRTIEEQEP